MPGALFKLPSEGPFVCADLAETGATNNLNDSWIRSPQHAIIRKMATVGAGHRQSARFNAHVTLDKAPIVIPKENAYMKKKIDGLLYTLREAIHEAIAESGHVAKALAELEQEGCCPMFSVDVALPDGSPTPEDETFDEALMLTADDEHFLRSIKVAIPA